MTSGFWLLDECLKRWLVFESYIKMSVGAAWMIMLTATRPRCVLRGFRFRDLGFLGRMPASG